MAGHTRKNNIFVCPGSAERTLHIPLPSDSPPPTYEFHGFQVPPGDRWHWRNPNWVSPPREQLHEGAHRDASLTPTEPLSDGEPGKENIAPFSVRGSPAPDYPADEWDDDSDPFLIPTHRATRTRRLPASGPRSQQSPITDISLNTALRAGTPLYSVYRVPRQDIPKVQRTAQREGKLFSVMKAPPAHPAKIPREKSQETVWVILSDREEDLRYAVHSQRMPGALTQGSTADFSLPQSNAAAQVMQSAPFSNVVDQPAAQHVLRNATFDQSMYSIPGELGVQGHLRTAGHGFLQMAFAGIIGGLVVTYGRALL
ncbi:hypothetical protein DFH29DRAFT_993277 [Suillus ampliporus]|nr:hypothetical protein DFH29DRAFT_993277 [Suillus ampliporus]